MAQIAAPAPEASDALNLLAETQRPLLAAITRAEILAPTHLVRLRGRPKRAGQRARTAPRR